jgi:hypothetical protein
MNWMLVAAALGAGTVGAFTDWLFMGMLFHDAYLVYPETWWPRETGKENRAIILSSLIGYVMSGGVVVLCAAANVHSITLGLEFAAIAWLAGPAVVVVVNGFFFRVDPRITVAHCLGWLARMAIAGAAAGYVLGR